MLRTQYIELRSAEFAALPLGSASLGERSFFSVFAAAAAALLQGAAKRPKLPEREKKTDLNALYLSAATREKPPATRRCLAAPPSVLVGMAARGCQGRLWPLVKPLTATLRGHAMARLWERGRRPFFSGAFASLRGSQAAQWRMTAAAAFTRQNADRNRRFSCRAHTALVRSGILAARTSAAEAAAFMPLCGCCALVVLWLKCC